MVEIILELKNSSKIPIYAETLTPDNLAGKGLEEISSLTLLEGSRLRKISDLFNVKIKGEPSNSINETSITLLGDFSKFRYIGKGMTGGKITVSGNGGFYLGQEMRGGVITVKGDAESWTGAMMKGGQIEVFGSVGDYLASAYRGSTKGMSDGVILVHGNAGAEAGCWMINGLIMIDGDAGEFLGIHMQDGTIVVKGKCAGRAGAGMTGGKIVIMGSLPEILPSFTYTEMREKVKFGKEKIAGSFYVYTGDILEEGEGKIFVSRCRNRHLNPVDEIFPEPNLSVNKSAMPFVEKMIKEQQKIGVEVSKHKSGATIIDAGVKAKGSEEAGILVTLICLGGLADISIRNEKFGTLELPTLYEKMKGHPATATLGSQFAGWAVKTEDFYSLGSGPARAISMQPRKLYEKLCYRDNTDVAVLMLESDKMPTESAIEYIARESNVPASKLYLIVASTSSIVGSVQIAGRVVETGIHKLSEVGFNPNKIIEGEGSAPVAPIHPKSDVAMGITNDMILYGGDVRYKVSCKTDDEIMNIIDRVPSISSRDYGKPFYEIFKAAGRDFYKIDPGLFAPAKISITNVNTGSTFEAGKINPNILKQSINLIKVNG